MAQLAEHLSLVVGLNQPTAPVVTLGSHSSGSCTIPRCKLGVLEMAWVVRVEDHQYVQVRGEHR